MAVEFEPNERLEEGRPRCLRRVSLVVAVSSCKGGVGKSTVALALALMLKRSGAKVGLLDADVYGPSLPSLLGLSDPSVYFTDESEEDSEAAEDTNEQTEGGGGGRMKGGAATTSRKTTALKGRPRSFIRYEETESRFGEEIRRDSSLPSGNGKRRDSLAMKPLTVWGIKHMSYGFIAKQNHQVNRQFLSVSFCLSLSSVRSLVLSVSK